MRFGTVVLMGCALAAPARAHSARAGTTRSAVLVNRLQRDGMAFTAWC